ncbi:MAG: STAS domain-containing protein [Armatimonadota bacterium]
MSEAWHVSRLDVNIRYEQDFPIIEAKGECDLITSRKLRDAVDNLISTGHCALIFDFRYMTYIDSSGFRVLLEAKNKAFERGGDIVLVSLTAPVERIFDLLRLGELIARTDTVEDAISRLKGVRCK